MLVRTFLFDSPFTYTTKHRRKNLLSFKRKGTRSSADSRTSSLHDETISRRYIRYLVVVTITPPAPVVVNPCTSRTREWWCGERGGGGGGKGLHNGSHLTLMHFSAFLLTRKWTSTKLAVNDVDTLIVDVRCLCLRYVLRGHGARIV